MNPEKNEYEQMKREAVYFIIDHIASNPRYHKAIELEAKKKSLELSLLNPFSFFNSSARYVTKMKIQSLNEAIYRIDPFFDEHEDTMRRWNDVDFTWDEVNLSTLGAPDVPIRLKKEYDDGGNTYQYVVVKQKTPRLVKSREKSSRDMIQKMRKQLEKRIRD